MRFTQRELRHFEMPKKSKDSKRCQTILGVYEFSTSPEAFQVQCVRENHHSGEHEWNIFTRNRENNKGELKIIN